jgi:SAM-dependent methyltransferase
MFRNVLRRLVDGLLQRRLSGPFVHDAGNCWIIRLPHLAHRADNGDEPHRSVLTLYENGVALRPAHAVLDDVRRVGFGAYCHRRDRLCFSSSDNSDPNENGRTYRFALSPWLYRRRVAAFGPAGAELTRPITYRRLEATPDRIRADVAYALGIGRTYLDQMRQFVPSPAGRTVLEIGPGIHCGSVLLLAAYGARPLVSDRFLTPWDAAYHSAFYAALADELARQDPDADVRPIRAVVEAGGYPADVLGCFEKALEEISIDSDSVDVVVSNAVLEHLYDPERSFAQLWRITRPGGLGLHQIDHRDHRDFRRPLEYLLLSDDEFDGVFARSHGECGNRYRPDEVTTLFRQVGFEVLDFAGTVFAETEYLQRFLPRLRRACGSRYRGWPATELRTVSGFCRVRKPALRLTPAPSPGAPSPSAAP